MVPSSDDKSAKKVSTVPKTVQFLKSNDGTDNGTKKVPRYITAVQKYRGTAHLWSQTFPSLAYQNQNLFVGVKKKGRPYFTGNFYLLFY